MFLVSKLLRRDYDSGYERLNTVFDQSLIQKYMQISYFAQQRDWRWLLGGCIGVSVCGTDVER
jgi:hypothetical protein